MNFTMEPEVVISIIAIVAGVTIFTFIRSRHIERMLQVQMGVPLDDIQRSYLEVKLGLLFIGIGIGMLIAFVLNQVFGNSISSLYPAMVFLFGGIGLFASFFFIEHIRRKS